MGLVTFLGIWFVREAGIALATVGVAFLCENLLRGLLAPFFGALSDRIGRRPMLVVAALGTGIVLPCFLLVDSPWKLFAWSLALGTTGAINMPVATALLVDLAPPERRQTVLAVNYTAMSVAYTIGVSPAGFIAEQGYGYLAAISAVGYAIVAALYLLSLQAPSRAEGPRRESRVLRSTLQVFRDRRFLGFAALGFVFPLGMGLVVFASPLFAASLGLGEGFIGLVLGLNSIIVALLAVPVAARIEAAGPFRWLGLAALLVAACFLCFALVPQPHAALIAGTVIFSFGEIVFSSAVPAAVAQLAPADRRGAYQGGWTLVQATSMGSALFLSGLLSGAMGWQGAWLAYAAVILASAGALFVLRERMSEGARR